MKKYIIVADNITGIKGKQLWKDEVHEECELQNITELEQHGFIKEYVPPIISEEKELKEKKSK